MARPAPSPLLLPLRVALGVLGLTALVVVTLVCLSSCHHAGWV